MIPIKIAPLIAALMMPSPSSTQWTAANGTKRPPSGKDRSKIKAARKQRNKK